MVGTAWLRVEKVSAEDVIFHIEALDRSIVQRECTFKLMRRVVVHDDRPANASEVLFQQRVVWESGRCQVPVSLSRIEAYTYSGVSIDVKLEATLHIDDGAIFDTELTSEYDLPLANKPQVRQDVRQIIHPADLYSFFDNFSALPAFSQVKIVAVMMITAIVGMVGFGAAILLESIYVAAATFTVSAMVFAVLYSRVKKRLKNYLERRGGLHRLPIVPGEPVRMDQLLDARATIDIDEITLRVVAVNMECGLYKRGQGTRVRMVGFRSPVRGLVLYERTIRDISKGDSLSEHLRGDLVYFDEMFEFLYPPNRVSRDHGVDIRWEAQILHEHFVDHEILGSNEVFEYRHFVTDRVEST